LRYGHLKTDNTREVLAGGGETNKLFASSLGVMPDNSIKLFIGVEGRHDITFLKHMAKMLKQAARYLGFEPHEITILIAAGCLKPLGHPARNATKFFATQALEQLGQDEKWLARASDAICEYWRERNARNRSCERGPNGNGRFNRRIGRNGRADSPAKATVTG
jgi:hypothetical protein